MDDQDYKFDFVYLASHGFSVRMVIQTNLLGKLTEKGYRVALISLDDEDFTLKEYCLSNNVRLISFNPKSSFWSTEYFLLRRYLLEDIRKNPALWEKHLRVIEGKEVSQLRKFKIRCYYFLFLFSKFLPFIKRLVLRFENSKLRFTDAERLIKELSPKLVVSTYPINIMESSLLNSAKKNKRIRTVIQLLSWDNITCKGRFPVLAHSYISWGPIMTEELQEYLLVNKKDIYTTGVPHFDVHRLIAENRDSHQHIVRLGLDPVKPYIFFAMSSPYFAPREIEIIEKIAYWVNEGSFGDIQFIIRPHPQNVQGNMADRTWLPRLKNLNNSSVAVDFPQVNDSKIPWSMQLNDMYKLGNLIGGASVVLNTCSTISIDSLFYNVPIIVTAFDNDEKLPWWQSARRNMDYEHFAKLLQTKALNRVNNYQELFLAIRNYIANPETDSEYRKIALHQECRIDDNVSATTSVVHNLEEILKLYFSNESNADFTVTL